MDPHHPTAHPVASPHRLPEMPRYLAPFHPKRLQHAFADVLIIGGGLAGLRAAQEIDPALRCIVVTKDVIEESNSAYAQGGIASVWDAEDRFDNHIQDTLVAGGSLCDRAIVEMVVREAPRHVEDLIAWGTHFDQSDGKLILGREGGHSHQRIIHALGDATGREIMRAMIERTRSNGNVEIWPNTFTIDLVTHQGACRGALLAPHGKSPMMLWASQTILCTGGCGQVFRESTNPRVATGDGHALAYRAGAQMRDMEFMQFHPTVLYIAGSSRTLITEAVRGEGAFLIDCNGYRFMSDYDKRLELAPRDVVSQSIVRQMEKTQHPSVYLTMQHLDPQRVRQRFPGIAEVCRKFGLDIATDRIPVRPGAHYMIGGVVVDDRGQTTIPGLLAAGEVTSTGLHGANRLASNSLLEGLVFGKRAGGLASQLAATTQGRLEVPPVSAPDLPAPDQPLDLSDVRNAVQSLMWRKVGVERNQQRLAEAVEGLEGYCRYALANPQQTIEGWELQNLLTVALMMAHAALARQESRGVHLRTDFPKLDDLHWRRHLVFQRDTIS